MRTNIIKTMSALIFLASVTLLKAQLVNLGNSKKPNEYVWYYAVAHSGDTLWEVSQGKDLTTGKNFTKISKHDGLLWTDVFRQEGVLNLYSGLKLRTCAGFYKGNLYFTAHFDQLTLDSVNYNQRMFALFKWDGTGLSYVDSIGYGGEIYDMDTFQNKLVISGTFRQIGTTSFNGLAQYDGSTWSNVGTPADWVNLQPGIIWAGPYNGYSSQLVPQGDKLYITGMCKIKDSAKPIYRGLGVYDGLDLNPVPLPEFADSYFSCGKIVAHPDSSRYYATDSCFKTYYCQAGQSKVLVNNKKSNYLIGGPITSEKYAYRGASVYTIQYTDDHPGNAVFFIEKLTGTKLKKIYLPDSLVLTNAEWNGWFGIFGKNSVFITLEKNLFEPFHFRLDSDENLSGTVSGKVFADLNNNCTFDASEPVLKNTWVTLNPGNRTHVTDEYGDYIIGGLEAGNYKIKLKESGKLHPCSSSQYNVSLTNDSSITRDFVLDLDSSQDLSVEIVAHRGFQARRGFQEYYEVYVSNRSLSQRSGKVNIHVGNGFKSLLSFNSQLHFKGKSGVWTFKDLKPGEGISARFGMRTDLEISLDTVLDLYACLDSVSQDWDNTPGNDFDTCRVKIVASYDPNDKASSPSGLIPKGTRHIQYHINFQNLGNDTAFRVVVVDTIDLRIPLEKIILGASSHPYTLKVKDNILTFEFENIRLPHSASNEAKSKGFIRFSAMLEPDLPYGTAVHNMANIYFDYNAPIKTKMASVRIAYPNQDIQGVVDVPAGLNIYPNPGSGVFCFDNQSVETAFTLYNASGMQVYNGILRSGINTFDLGFLSSGIYLVITADGHGKAKFIVQQ